MGKKIIIMRLNIFSITFILLYDLALLYSFFSYVTNPNHNSNKLLKLIFLLIGAFLFTGALFIRIKFTDEEICFYNKLKKFKIIKKYIFFIGDGFCIKWKDVHSVSLTPWWWYPFKWIFISGKSNRGEKDVIIIGFTENNLRKVYKMIAKKIPTSRMDKDMQRLLRKYLNKKN
jgi:hypothetical protein